EFDRGDSMAVGASLGRGPSATLADAYVVLELPNGQLMSWTGGGLVPGLVPVARGFVPFQFETSLLQLVIPFAIVSWRLAHETRQQHRHRSADRPRNGERLSAQARRTLRVDLVFDGV